MDNSERTTTETTLWLLLNELEFSSGWRLLLLGSAAPGQGAGRGRTPWPGGAGGHSAATPPCSLAVPCSCHPAQGFAAPWQWHRPHFHCSLPKKLPEANPLGLLRLSHSPGMQESPALWWRGRDEPSPHALTNWFAPKLWFMKQRTCELGTSWFKRRITKILFFKVILTVLTALVLLLTKISMHTVITAQTTSPVINKCILYRKTSSELLWGNCIIMKLSEL